MEKTCTTCGKIVYPMEQLKCFDQIWHKACFKCTVCGMTLNMKSYRASDKKPFCIAHCPQAKSYTFASDSQEIQRVRQNTAVISKVSYTGKKAEAQNAAAPVVVNRRLSEAAPQPQQSLPGQPGSISDFDPERHNTVDRRLDPNAGRRGSTIFASSELPSARLSRSDSRSDHQPDLQGLRDPAEQPQAAPQQPQEAPQQPQEAPQQPQEAPQQPQEAPQQPQEAPQQPQEAPQQPREAPQQPQEAPQQPQEAPQQPREASKSPEAEAGTTPAITAPGIVTKPVAAERNRGRLYRAQFSYAAQDADEISFSEGDIVTNGDPIDAGWMYGILERTGQYGMMPFNYMEEIQ